MEIDRNILTVTARSTAAAADQSLLATIKRRDQAGTQEVDKDAFYEIVGIELTALAAGTLQLHSTTGPADKLGVKYQFPATFNSGFIPLKIAVLKEKPVLWTTTGTNPTVEFTLYYRIRRPSSAKPS